VDRDVEMSPARVGPAMADRQLWLVRHGESTWNATGMIQGHQDPGLSPLGRIQAADCARRLASRMSAARLYSSDLRRAVETAAIIGEALALDVRIEPMLRERSLGTAEGEPSALFGREDSGVSGGRVVDADAAPEGGESVRQLYERAASCAARILSAHAGDVVLVCHGGVVRVLIAWIDGVGPDQMIWPEIENGAAILRPVPADVPAQNSYCGPRGL
jgi:probable phosphoglycerate mutase